MKALKIFITLLLLSVMPYICFANDLKTDIENIADEYDVNYDNISDLSVQDLFHYISDNVKANAERPIKVTISLVGVILLCATINSLNINQDNNTQKIGNTVCTLIIYLNMLQPIRNLINGAGECLFQVKNFMSSFLPIFASISVASGDGVTSGVYTGLFLSGIIVIANICIKYLFPSIQLYFAMIIANSISEYVNLENFCSFYLKIIKNAMKLSVSIICGALTLQTIISQGTDTLLVKAGKAIAGGSIPVIGSALRDAVGSVYASMEAIKGFAGAIGIAVIISIFAPTMITMGIYWICTNILHIFSGLFNEKHINTCVKGYIDVIELTISLTVLFIVMLMFSITIMITLTNGV